MFKSIPRAIKAYKRALRRHFSRVQQTNQMMLDEFNFKKYKGVNSWFDVDQIDFWLGLYELNSMAKVLGLTEDEIAAIWDEIDPKPDEPYTGPGA